MLRRTLFPRALHLDFRVDNAARCVNTTIMCNSSNKKQPQQQQQQRYELPIPFVVLSDHTLTNTDMATFQRTLPVDYRRDHFSYEYSDFVAVNWEHRLVFFNRLPAVPAGSAGDGSNRQNAAAGTDTPQTLAVPMEALLMLLAGRAGAEAATAAGSTTATQAITSLYETLYAEMMARVQLEEEREEAAAAEAKAAASSSSASSGDESWRIWIADGAPESASSSSSSSPSSTTTIRSSQLPLDRLPADLAKKLRAGRRKTSRDAQQQHLMPMDAYRLGEEAVAEAAAADCDPPLAEIRVARGLTAAHLHQTAAAFDMHNIRAASFAAAIAAANSNSSSGSNGSDGASGSDNAGNGGGGFSTASSFAAVRLTKFGNIRVVPSPSSPPIIWRRADVDGPGRTPVVADVFTLRTQALVRDKSKDVCAPTTPEDDAAFADALRASLDEGFRHDKIEQVTDLIDRYGFVVVSDPVLERGLPFPLGVNVADEPSALPSSGLVRELADMHGDSVAQRVVWRRNATEFVMRYLFGVVMQSYYGMAPLWGRYAGTSATEEEDIDHLDTAYMSMGIDLHTDATYLAGPPKLQGFGLVHWDEAQSVGGANSLVDGFAVADYMSREFPAEYNCLCNTPVPCLYAKDGRATAAHRPVISLAAAGHIDQISFNAYDRASSIMFARQHSVGGGNRGPSSFSKDAELLYKSLSLFSDLCQGRVGPSDFCYALQPQLGNILIFNNHRCLHARTEFKGPRLMCGSYIAEDDYLSQLNRFRLS